MMAAKTKRKPYRVLCANGHAVEVESPPSGLWVVDLQGCGPHRIEKLVDGGWVEIPEVKR